MATPGKIGQINRFGLRITATSGGLIDVVCPVCGETGVVAPQEFLSTRCGSPRCGSTQGRTE